MNNNKGKFYIKNGDSYEEIKEIGDFELEEDEEIIKASKCYYKAKGSFVILDSDENKDLIEYEMLRLEQEERGEKAEA